MSEEQRFKVGDTVEVVPDFKYGEWVGQPLWIAGVTYDIRRGRLNYWIAEHWPPRHPGDITDEFWAEDLSLRSTSEGGGKDLEFGQTNGAPQCADAPSAPVKGGKCPTRGEIRIISGKRCRFIEREIEGDKWEVLEP